MYEPLPSLWFAQEGDMGVNAPLRHQQVISKLHVELGILYYKTKAFPTSRFPKQC